MRTTESGGPRGWDAAKRLKGRKRHLAVDTDGLLLGILVHAPRYLFEVKAPAEVKSGWDLYRLAGTIEAEQAMRPMSEGGVRWCGGEARVQAGQGRAGLARLGCSQ
ncbi:hypothetical protein JMJ55_22190 [Belnapia sp. T6]|uniref:Transposase n=1 Tax=Belnapia mucosa TaxID=2804532 RepID=A0ABS1V8Q8_9PROT|nr:hypothetical protein [Belnapia mucosa]